MSEFKNFFKKNFVVVISGAAALISCAFVPVTDYVEYIDTDVMGILFCLMLIIAGLRGNNLLAKIIGFVVKKAHIESTRRAAFIIAVMTFFLSMLVTNDAALIALVPVTAVIFAEYPSLMIYAIAIQTAAANMGSMATPVGNPQNLFIFSSYGVSAEDFFRAAAPTAVLSLGLILLLCMFMKNMPLVIDDYSRSELVNKRYTALYIILFVIVLLSVFGVLNVLVAFASVCVVVVIIEPKRFTEVDYGLILTFIFFFVFVGNIRNIPSVSRLAESVAAGREFPAAVVISQVISNVPATVMLSGFTDNWKALMLGADIGALGTPVASLASLISLRIYGETENSKQLRYLAVFTLVSVFMLAVLYLFAAFTQL